MGAPRVNLSDDVIDRLTPVQRQQFGVKTREEINSDLEDREEKTIQRMVESWLTQRGYWPRSPAYLDGRIPPLGWFVHYNPKKTKGNPLILDLIIMANSSPRQYLELELKARTTKVADHQQLLVNQGASIARSAEDAVEIITEWEKTLDFG